MHLRKNLNRHGGDLMKVKVGRSRDSSCVVEGVFCMDVELDRPLGCNVQQLRQDNTG